MRPFEFRPICFPFACIILYWDFYFFMLSFYISHLFPAYRVCVCPFPIIVPTTRRQLCMDIQECVCNIQIFISIVFSTFLFAFIICRSVLLCPNLLELHLVLLDYDNDSSNGTDKGSPAVQWPWSWWTRAWTCGNRRPGSPPAPPAHRTAPLTALCPTAVTRKGKCFLVTGAHIKSDYSSWICFPFLPGLP